MQITFVKKILADGTLCRKCADVEARLQRDGWDKYIHRVAVADERDPNSEGMVLATRLGVDRAPFFIVSHEDGRTEVHTVYLRLVKEVLEPQLTRSRRGLADTNRGQTLALDESVARLVHR
jgi:hypothetical protein